MVLKSCEKVKYMLELDKESPIKNKATKESITIGANCKLTLTDVHLLADKSVPVHLSPGSYAVVEQSYHFLKSFVDQRQPVYGVNTQFGDQVRYLDSNIRNDDEISYYASINQRQENAIKYLACGLGDIISPEIVKVAMLLRAHCLAQGYSGVSPTAIDAILACLNFDIIPIVRQYGSIGASGDLIPLAMIAAGIIGENVDVLYKGNRLKAPEAISMAGLAKFKPELRDGLAMINGTSFMTAIASLSFYHLKRLFKQMLSAIGMSLESMLVIDSAYRPMVHQLKHQSGEDEINKFLIDFWKGSQLITDLDKINGNNITHGSVSAGENSLQSRQDYYSLRAVPQGFGPFQENLERAITWTENEMNSVNDNPIIDAINNKIYHSANFMGYYVTDACDILKMNIGQASTWIHALIANMLHPRKNQGLPPNLVKDPSKNNGFRAFQLLAAALAVQNRKLAQSHQAFMLPTEGDNQDVNSLGTHAAFDLYESVANLERLTAILLMISTQAFEFRDVKKASAKSQAIYEIIREYSPTLTTCRLMEDEITTIINILKEEKV